MVASAEQGRARNGQHAGVQPEQREEETPLLLQLQRPSVSLHSPVSCGDSSLSRAQHTDTKEQLVQLRKCPPRKTGGLMWIVHHLTTLYLTI